MRPVARRMGPAMLACVAACAAAAPAHAAGGVEARNKALVLAMWHDVIDGRNIAAAPRYIAPDYRQHSPGIGQGRAALMTFLRHEFHDPAPLAKGYPLTNFAFVLADGDLVQLMFQRQMPSRDDPARMIDVAWYDTYRVKDGRIVEHWDSAQ